MSKKNVKSAPKKTTPKKAVTSKVQRVRAKPISATPVKKTITPPIAKPVAKQPVSLPKQPIHPVRIQTAEGWRRSQMKELKVAKAKSKS